MDIKIGHYSIINVYNPPSCFLHVNNLEFLSHTNRLILCGGFNAHHDMWGSSQNTTNGTVLVSLLDNHDYVILNSSSPTHFSLTRHTFWSLLDLAIVSNAIASNCSTTTTKNFLGSDNSKIHTTVNGVHFQETQFLPKWNFAKAKWPKFADMCDRTLLSFSPNLEHSYQLFETCILETSKEFIQQTKRYAKISVPWWNKECEQAMKNRKHAFTRMKRTRSPLDTIIFKRCRAKARQFILETKRSSWHNYCNSLKSNSHLNSSEEPSKNFLDRDLVITVADTLWSVHIKCCFHQKKTKSKRPTTNITSAE